MIFLLLWISIPSVLNEIIFKIYFICKNHKTVYFFQAIKYIEDSMFTLLCICLGNGIGSEFSPGIQVEAATGGKHHGEKMEVWGFMS